MNIPAYTISTKTIDLVARIDGNGRIGRFWQTLILSKWNELFAWLPVETVVYENQQNYIKKNGEITNYRAQLLTNKSDISVKIDKTINR